MIAAEYNPHPIFPQDAAINRMKDPIIKNLILSDRDRFIEYGSMAALLLAAVVVTGFVLVFSRAGLDLTDEGFYLNSISSPSNFSATVSQFGFIYHPIYLLVHGDVAGLRRIDYVLTYGLAVLSSFFVIKNSFGSGKFEEKILFFSFSVVIAVSSLLLTCFELPQSPSYNTLAFQSLLVGMIGVLLSHSAKSSVRILGYVLIGFSLWLAFMAKPTTALAFGLISFLHFAFSKKTNKPALFIPGIIAFVLLLVSALAIDGSVTAFVHRLISSIEIGRLLGAGNTILSIWRWDDFPLEGRPLYLLMLLSLSTALLIFLHSRWTNVSRITVAATCVITAAVSIGILFNFYPLASPFHRYTGLQLLALPAGCVAFLAATAIRKKTIQIERDKLILAITLLLLPFAYAFGTDRPYWLNAEGASFFWILSGVVLVSEAKIDAATWRLLFPVCGLSVLLSSIFIFGSIEYPMRQTQSLRADSDWISVGAEGNRLAVAPDLAKYIGGLRKLAADAGFKAGTPIIDLTGISPGVAYILDGTAPGAPWLLGGYAGSAAFVTAVLDAVPCTEIARSWVLISHDQRGGLSGKLLRRYGIDLDHDYEDLGFAIRPPNPFPRSYTHHLLKPLRTPQEADAICEEKLRERVSNKSTDF